MAFTSVGKVASFDDSFRAHIQHRTDCGNKGHIYGPRRAKHEEAQSDLRAIRLVAASLPDRAQAIEAMRAEAQL